MTKFGSKFCVGIMFVAGFPCAAATFTDVTSSAGINHVQMVAAPIDFQSQPYLSGGAAAGDFDNDGWVDLYFTRLDNSDILYRNLGDGSFADVTAAAFGPSHLADVQTNGAAWGDIDNDGDLDLYVTSLFANRYHLYVNDGVGGFTEQAVTRGADVYGTDTHFGFSPSFGDYDRDGFLDLYVTEWRTDEQNPSGALQNSRLLRNLGNASPGHFVDVTESAGVAMDDRVPLSTSLDSQTFTARFTDLDGDGHADLAIASDHLTSTLFWNNGDGTFTDGTAAAGVGTDRFGMGSAVGDYDLDGDLDWFVTSIYNKPGSFHDGNRLYRNEGNRLFVDATDVAGVRDGGWGWGAAMFDYDNDGDLDIVEANGQDFPFEPQASVSDGYETDPVYLWENDGGGAFAEVGAAAGLTDARSGKGVLTFDYDRDGDQDVVIVNNGDTPVLYRNDGGNDHDWLQVETEGTISNRQGSGAMITVLAEPDGQAQIWEVSTSSHYLGQSETTAHFGLGERGDGPVHLVAIVWPSGLRQTFYDVDRNTVLTAVEPLADFDSNGEVNWNDLSIWSDQFGLLGAATHADGDANGNGAVDGADLLVWQMQYGMQFAGSAIADSSTSPIPEPTAWVLLTVGIGASFGTRRQ